MGSHEEAAADVGLKLKLQQALKDAVAILGEEVGVDMDDEAQLVKVVQSSIGTKFISRWANLAAKIAIDAIKKVTIVTGEESRVLDGVMFNKDVTHQGGTIHFTHQ